MTSDCDSPAQLNGTHARALVHSLVACGVKRAVVSPGSRSTPLVLALTSCAGITVTTILDERVAGFVALGMARAGGCPVALVCTSGTASAHYLPAVIEASCARVPLIVISADRPVELHQCGALQTIDQTHLFGRHVRAFVDLSEPSAQPSPRWLGSVTARIVDMACRAPRGPVHINVPFREPLWSADDEGHDGSAVPLDPPTVVRCAARLDAGLVQTLAARISHARRGVIVCGPMNPERAVNASGFASSIHRLAVALGWPIVAEPTSQARFVQASGFVVAAADLMLRVPSFVARTVPDLVLRFGQTPTCKATQAWLAQVGVGKTVLIDEAGEWHDPSYAADTLVVAEPGSLCAALATLVRPHEPNPDWLASWQRGEEMAQAAIDHVCREGFWEGGIARTVATQVGNNTALHIASSMPIRDLDAFAPVQRCDARVYANRGASGIDGIIATAAGEALADTTRRHLVVLGDLAFLHDLGALRAATQLRAPLVVVLINNGGGGIFSFLPIATHPTAFVDNFRTPQAADFPALVRAAGATWQSAGSYGELSTAITTSLDAAQRTQGVYVIGLEVDLDHNVQQHSRAALAVQEALQAQGDEQGGAKTS